MGENSDMSITTNEFALSKDEYFGLLTSELFKPRWPLMIGLGGLATYALLNTNHWILGLGFAVSAVFYPLFILSYAWRFATSRQNHMVYVRRHYQFDDEYIYTQMEDGSDSNIRYDYVTRVVTKRRHHLLYVSKTQFICVPFRAFKTQEDRHAFETLLRNHHLT